MFRARQLGMPPAPQGWSVLRRIVDWLEAHWREPDEGIWEVRGPKRHFVHSKVMAWVATDRTVRAIEEMGLDGPVERFRQMRADIHAEVCREGYDAGRNDVGLFAEEYDPGLKRLVGNFPQAFTHLALISSAKVLSAPGPA